MRNSFFCLMCFILLSCSGKNKIPAEIIQQKAMQNILWDVIRAQSLSAEMARKDHTVNEAAETKILTQKIFEFHHITALAFDQSYSWYTSHPEVMRTIFDSMNIQNQRQNDVKERGGYKPFKKDSINKKKAVE